MKPRVVYWNNQPTPYVVDRLNAVADLGTIDIEAWFDRVREADRSWELDESHWRFAHRTLDTPDPGRLRDQVPLAALRASRPDVFVANYDRLHMIVGALLAPRYARRVALRALPSFTAWSGTSRTRELAKQLVFHAVDGAKVPGPDGAAFARRYGLPASRIWTVKQSIMRADYAALRDVSAEERRHRRDALGLDDRCAFVYVGRIWRGKGLETLIEASEQVDDRAAQLLIVGNGTDEAHFRARTAGLPGVRWLGFVQPAELPAIYAACDVLVFPTLGDPNGLVVEEAMASGVPVISSDAAGDITRRVPQGRAGYVVPVGDAAALAARMSELAADPALRARLGERAAELGAEFTPERYAADFETFVNELMAKPRRRSIVRAVARALPGTLLSVRMPRTAS